MTFNYNSKEWFEKLNECLWNLLQFGPMVLEEMSKMWNGFRQTGGRTDGGTDIQTDKRLSEKGSL